MKSSIKELSPFVREEYPFSSQYFQQFSDGEGKHNQHYLDEGRGPVVLLLHGNPTWSFYFRNLIIRLVAQGFRCIVPDHMGCGLSDKPQKYTYNLERRISDVERILEHLGIMEFNLVVHDWGGAIGLGLAGRMPEKVIRIAILNSAAFRSKLMPLSIAFLRIPLLGEFLIRALNIFAIVAINRAALIPLSPVAREGLLFPYQSWAERIAIWKFVKDIPIDNNHPSYATLLAVEKNLEHLKQKKIGLFWGDCDFCFNHHFYKRWLEFFPLAKKYRYPKAGHYVLEDAGKEIIHDITKFISEVED